MNAEISFITDEGYEYLIVFQEYTHYSEVFDVKVVDVSIILISDIIEQNSHKTLAHFISIIKSYLQENKDTVLYYYCDVEPIKMRENRKKKMSFQEFRMQLFLSMFERSATSEFQHFEVKALNTPTGNHSASLLTHKNNKDKVNLIIDELHFLFGKEN